ncbi:Probable ethanolamine kinase [Linum perenne]
MQRLKQEMGAAENTRNHMDVIEHGVPANGRSGSGSDQIPSSSCTVDPKLSIVDMSPRIIELCKDLFKKWLELDESCFTVERVSGGITNLCKSPGFSWIHDCCLVTVYFDFHSFVLGHFFIDEDL